MSKSSRAKRKLNLSSLRSERNLAEKLGFHWWEIELAKQKLFASLIAPIMRTFDYSGFIKRVFDVKPIED